MAKKWKDYIEYDKKEGRWSVYIRVQDGTDFWGNFQTYDEAVFEWKRADCYMNGNKNDEFSSTSDCELKEYKKNRVLVEEHQFKYIDL